MVLFCAELPPLINLINFFLQLEIFLAMWWSNGMWRHSILLARQFLLAWAQATDSTHSTELTSFSWSSTASPLSDFEREGIVLPNPSSLFVAFSNLIRENVHYVATGVFQFWGACVEGDWLSKTTNFQKCLLKLLNNHVDVVISC